MTTNTKKTTRKKTASVAASTKRVAKDVIDAKAKDADTAGEPVREVITINKPSYITVQPSLFEPLRETKNLTPAQKEKLRTVLRTIDTGEFWVLKQALTLMAFNFFSTTKDPDKDVQIVETDEFRITFTPSIYGSPTMYDADILMFATSALANDIRKNKNDLTEAGEMPYKGVVVFQLKDFSSRLGRSRNARTMQQIKESLDRLSMSSLTIEKTGKIGNREVRAGQTIGHFLEGYKFCEIKEQGKKPIAAIEVRLADWIVRDIAEGRALWFPDEYFGLTPFEKALFMIARSHVGLRPSMIQRDSEDLSLTSEDLEMEPDAHKTEMTVGNARIEYFYHHLTLPELLERLRYKNTLKKLKLAILKVIRSGGLPSYELALDERKRSLSQQVIYIFRKDDKLKANIFAACLKYPGFKETFESLTTRRKLEEKESAPKRRKTASRSTKKTGRTTTAKRTVEDDPSPDSLFAAELDAFVSDNGETPAK